MHYLKLFFLIISLPLFAEILDLGEGHFLWPKVFNQKSIQSLQKGEYVINVNIETFQKNGEDQQSLHFYSAGLHPKNCSFAMRKLGRYEIYPHYLDFVKEANYDEEKHFLHFTLDHPLLPFKMGIEFNIPRIQNVGVYPYGFDKGFLKGLKGTIELSEDYSLPSKDRRCLMYTTAEWSGPHTGIPKTVFELFSSTLTRVAFERMFRMSSL